MVTQRRARGIELLGGFVAVKLLSRQLAGFDPSAPSVRTALLGPGAASVGPLPTAYPMSLSPFDAHGSSPAPHRDAATTDLEPAVSPARQLRVLFINDTARNGGPGRSLYYILRFLDPAVVHRAVVLPRSGVIGELLSKGGVADELLYEPTLVENPVEPWSRAIERDDFAAPLPLRAVRLAGNVARGGWSIARLTSLVRRGRYDLLYCNGTNADFAGGAVAWTSGVPALWHVRYTSLPRALEGVHGRLAASRGVRRILCVSGAAAKLFSHCDGKVRVLHNALDVEEFSPSRVKPSLRAELGVAPDEVSFGSQGRILRRKGY